MIRFSDISGHPVMDKTSATTVGKIDAPVEDPLTQRVIAFRVKRSKGPGDVLLWSSVAGLGPDALTVDSPERLAEPPAEWKHRSSSKLDLLGRLVLTEHGHQLGKVRDVEFDPAGARGIAAGTDWRSRWWLGPVAAVLAVAAALLRQPIPGPLRPHLSLRPGAAVAAVGALVLALGAIAALGAAFVVQLWVAAIGLMVMLAGFWHQRRATQPVKPSPVVIPPPRPLS